MSSTACKTEKRLKPGRVAVIGTQNWLGVAEELFRRGGFRTESIPDQPGHLAAIRWAIKARNRYSAFHHIRGGNVPTTFYLAMLTRRPQVWHWIGTDILDARAKLDGGGVRKRLFLVAAKRLVRAHLCDSPAIQKELAQMGIEADVVRLLPGTIETDVMPLPPKPAVLCYWRPNSRDFHNAPIIFELAEAFPETPFRIVGDDGNGLSNVPSNVEFLGVRSDMDAVYAGVSVYIRFPHHDSLSAMVLEMLARGRYVIYNQPLEVTGYAVDFNQARTLLADYLTRREPNYEAARWVKNNFSLAEQVNSLADCYRKLLS